MSDEEIDNILPQEVHNVIMSGYDGVVGLMANRLK